MEKEHITLMGYTNFRNQQRKFGIKPDDRRRHIYIIGKTGVGKSTLLENMIVDDIRAGHGLAFLDPHGDAADKMLDYIPAERVQDTVYIDPSDEQFPLAFNPLEQVSSEFSHLVASGIMGVFKKIWVDAWSARMEYILNNTLLALLEYPSTTLLDIMKMLNDAKFRKQVVDNLKDPVIKSFWVNEFARYSQKFETEATAAIQNKVGQFISNPLIRNILGQPKSSINMRKMMDEGKIIIVNLSKGKIGEDNSALLGAMIITKFQLAAMSRVDTPEKERRDFYLYVDEFQNFATESFANILSEARKYHLSLILANQYLDQLDEKGKTTVRSAIFGNVGTMVVFRIGAEDAEFVEKEFMPEFEANDLVNLAKYNNYIKLMIDGVASRPFSSQTFAPHPLPDQSFRKEIIETTHLKYTIPKQLVEEKIASGWAADSEKQAQEKVVRRHERPLADVLKPKLSHQSGSQQSKRFQPPKQFSQPTQSRQQPFRQQPIINQESKANVEELKKALEKSLNKNENNGEKPTSEKS